MIGNFWAILKKLNFHVKKLLWLFLGNFWGKNWATIYFNIRSR